MTVFSGAEVKDYVPLENLEVELWKGVDAEEAEGRFALCFWIYIDNCVSFPSSILVQKHPDVSCNVPFLYLDNEKKLKLFPLLFIYKETPSPDNPIPLAEVPCASSETEFPMKKWVHVSCEISREFMRLYVDGEIVGENPMNCSLDMDLFVEGLKRLCLACPDENKDVLHGFVYRLDILAREAAIKKHYVKDPPFQLSIDHSSTSEIEEDSDGVWSIVGGKPHLFKTKTINSKSSITRLKSSFRVKNENEAQRDRYSFLNELKASCRRIFSLDVVLSDAFGGPVKKDLEVVSSLLYADNGVPVENTADAEPALLINCDGIEYGSHDRPCKLINGRTSFKLKISQLSSKCDNRLFQIMFDVPRLGKYPFLETLSLPIRCVSRSKTTRAASITLRKSSSKTYYGNGCESPSPDDGSMQLITNIIREAKPSPSSKRIKLGQDMPFVMFNEGKRQANKVHHSHAWNVNQDTAHAMSMKKRPEDPCGTENNSCASDNSEATNSDPSDPKSVLSSSSPISDLIIFKYCLGGPAEKCHLLKEIAISATEEQLAHFANQVSLFSGCLHHRHQIKMAKRLVEEGIQAWTSVSGNNHHVLWENLVFVINEHFMKIACSTRPLMDQDLECLRRIAGCRDVVLQEDFERMWSWLFPVAFTLSQSAVNPMWDSMSPLWIEGFITKEEAESTLQGLQDPGTFLLRFPTSRSWPHPDAGNLVVTYVDSDYTIRHRLLSFDFIHSFPSKETTVTPLQELLLQEPKLSRLGRVIRSE